MSINFKLYAVLVADSVLIYDHMATITDEITFIWCRPKALSAILFLVNRYVALLGNVYMLYVYFLPISDERFQLWFSDTCRFAQQNPSCQRQLIFRDLLFFFQQILVCLILTIRIYALYCCSKRLLTWMIITVFALGGVTGGTSRLSSSIFVPGFDCFESYSEEIDVSQ
jgi:hypothetical protein